ncbi:hypothetical protein BOX15_Mlig010250g1 [Macrostomum lignano]|uniref:Uncharacterized protein n=1 Tax=Macrostomum lignano TaxID=282301 RepID=A0A267H0Y4_9PLAT|nr:hypothetical protein BOX15_Mlig010250g1 [Macrostomum lignano]
METMPAAFLYLVTTYFAQQLCVAVPQPEFQRDSNRTSNFLASDEVWVPGTTTLVTMRMVGEPLDIAVRLLNGPASFGQPKLYLMVKCSQSDSFVTAELFTGFTEPISATGENNNKLGRVFCKHRQPFSVQPVQSRSNQFRLKLIDNAGRVPFEESLDLSAEIAVRAAYNRLELTSSSLLIYNWDSLLSFKVQPAQHPGAASQSVDRVLSEEGKSYLFSLFYEVQQPFLQKVNFLKQSFIKLVNNASLVMRRHLTVSIIVRFDEKSCSEPVETSSAIVISSGDPTLRNESYYKRSDFFQPCCVLNLQTGALEVNEVLLGNLFWQVIRRRKSIYSAVFFCLAISSSNKAMRYHSSLTLKKASTIIRPELINEYRNDSGSENGKTKQTPARVYPSQRFENEYTSVYPSWFIGTAEKYFKISSALDDVRRQKCRNSADSMEVQLISGMIDVLIKTPITCFKSSKAYRVFHNGTVCAGQVGGDGFRNCSQYSVSKFYSAIRFDGMLSTKHAGVYTFATEDTVFKFIVTVKSLPLFRTDAQSGDLQAESMVTELVQLFNLSCTAFYSGVSPVSLRPSFLVKAAGKLLELSVHEFTQYLGTAPQKLEVKRSDDNNSSSRLQLYMPYVEKPRAEAISFVVRCRASLTAAVTKELLGTSVEYSTETRGIVRFTHSDEDWTFRNLLAKLFSPRLCCDAVLLTTALLLATVAKYLN